ncbi:hypothetical protein DFQ26_006408 [Actinomortierella ambigua]|nr:hypothetical protein DFQ26_006408 [Actinomortierella ambigua]
MRFSAITLLATLAAPILAAKTYDVNWVNGVPSPQELDIAPGDAVRWTNNDGQDHAIVQTVAGPRSCANMPGGFNSGRKTPGQAYQRTFPMAGTFNYKDGIGANCLSKNATGTIFVHNGPRPTNGGGGGTATGTATATSKPTSSAAISTTAVPTATSSPPPRSGAESLSSASQSVWIGIAALVGALVL